MVILGGGVVGENAAIIATGMRAKVHVVDKSQERLDQLVNMFGDKIIPELSDKCDLNKLIAECDLLVCFVLWLYYCFELPNMSRTLNHTNYSNVNLKKKV